VGLFDSWSSFAGGVADGVSELGGFVSNNLGTLFGGYLDYAALEAQKAAASILPPKPSGSSQPVYMIDSGSKPSVGGVTGPVPEGFPMATVLLLVGSVVAVVLVLRK
jgi:hypothetical protein